MANKNRQGDFEEITKGSESPEKPDFHALDPILTPEEEEREKQEWIAARMREEEEQEARLREESKHKKKSRRQRREERAGRRLERQKAAAVRHRGFRRRIKVTALVLLTLVILAGAGVLYAGYTVSNIQVNFPNLYLNGIPVGGLTREETAAKLTEQGWGDADALRLVVKLPANVSYELDRCQAGLVLPLDKAVEAAGNYGHSGNILENLMLYLRSRVTPVELSAGRAELNEAYVRGADEAAVAEFKKKIAVEPYSIDEEAKELRLFKGAGELDIDLDMLFAQVSSALWGNDSVMEYYTTTKEPTMPDFQALYDQLNVEPQDAHFSEDSFEVVPEVVGCTFNVADAEKRWKEAEPLQEIVIPLEILEPEVTADMLSGALFRDCLGSQTTAYKTSSAARINNINLAVEKLNGVILMPGETFSYNETVGQRTTEAGFEFAPAYANGEVVQQVGGGICQVSSTLYCATLYAQLEIVYRESHYFKVDYLPWGQDATVSWPSPDFKFRNNRDYPVKIVATCDNDTKEMTIEIWGTDVDGSYVTLDVTRYSKGDSILPDVIVGWNVYLFINRYDADGNLISRTEGSASTYHKHDWDIEWPGGVNPHEVSEEPEEEEPEGGETGGDQPGVVISDETDPGEETGGETGSETDGEGESETGEETGSESGSVVID